MFIKQDQFTTIIVIRTSNYSFKHVLYDRRSLEELGISDYSNGGYFSQRFNKGKKLTINGQLFVVDDIQFSIDIIATGKVYAPETGMFPFNSEVQVVVKEITSFSSINGDNFNDLPY